MLQRQLHWLFSSRMHILCFLLPQTPHGKHIHTHLSNMALSKSVFLENIIFISYESFTGGTWCYKCSLYRFVIFLIHRALPFTVLPIDSYLVEYKSPANQSWLAGYQRIATVFLSYGMWGDYRSPQHAYIVVFLLSVSPYKCNSQSEPSVPTVVLSVSSLYNYVAK